ncbi:histidine-rich glycoprotein-like [Pomacea canaliculata]|uniref:histidine-rich glycoprotein-like n=1 Tax=Pomacea canaliculata TaxID=400727 RepID=UPI000D72F6D4|nr:histidine-rich glycoprotein-like [Pomacea canaliculata]
MLKFTNSGLAAVLLVIALCALESAEASAIRYNRYYQVKTSMKNDYCANYHYSDHHHYCDNNHYSDHHHYCDNNPYSDHYHYCANYHYSDHLHYCDSYHYSY